MTTLEAEYKGLLGQGNQIRAERKVQEVAEDFRKGNITVDENGIARNKINRTCTNEILDAMKIAGIQFDEKATADAKEAEIAKLYADQQGNARRANAEEIAEMRSAFGTGTTVVNILTGERIRL